MTNVRHSTKSPRWGTGPHAVRIGQAVLGLELGGQSSVYVDPFTEEVFDRYIGAERCMTGDPLDGYADRWIEDDLCPRADVVLAGEEVVDAPDNTWTAFVNPPNKVPGRDGGRAIKDAWRITERYHRSGWLGGGAVYVAFNLNQLQTLQRPTRKPIPGYRSLLHHDFLRCIPDRRQDFRLPTGELAEQPSHPMCLVLLPSRDVSAGLRQRDLFARLCRGLGEVW